MTTASGSPRSKQQSRSGGRATSQTRRSTATTSTATSGAGSGQDGHAHGTTVELPFVTARFHAPEMHLPTGQDFASAAETVRAQLPSPEQGLFYGGLAVSAALAVIDWPVALAIGVGHALVSRSMHQHESAPAS